jgi:hypothetical protein
MTEAKDRTSQKVVAHPTANSGKSNGVYKKDDKLIVQVIQCKKGEKVNL